LTPRSGVLDLSHCKKVRDQCEHCSIVVICFVD
jgi:hypothetical protein